MDDDTRLIERAYLTTGGDFENTSSDDLNPLADPPPGREFFRLDIENHGKTAGFITAFDIRFGDDTLTLQTADIQPVSPSRRHIDGISPNGARKEIPTQIEKPPGATLVFGAVWYRDIFGAAHCSRFILRIADTRDIPGHGLTRLDIPGVHGDYWKWD